MFVANLRKFLDQPILTMKNDLLIHKMIYVNEIFEIQPFQNPKGLLWLFVF